MSQDWFANVSEIPRIELPSIGGWIEVRRELSVETQRKAFGAAVKGRTQTANGLRVEYDATKLLFGLVEVYLVDWAPRVGWFAESGVTRVELPSGLGWVELHNAASVGTEKAWSHGVIKGQVQTADGPRTEFDAARSGLATVMTYLAAWSARTAQGAVVPLNETTVGSLKPSVFSIIEDAVEAHVKQRGALDLAAVAVSAVDRTEVSPEAIRRLAPAVYDVIEAAVEKHAKEMEIAEGNALRTSESGAAQTS